MRIVENKQETDSLGYTQHVVGIYAAAPNHRWTEQPESLAASSVLVLMKTEYGKVLLWLLEVERQK